MRCKIRFVAQSTTARGRGLALVRKTTGHEYSTGETRSIPTFRPCWPSRSVGEHIGTRCGAGSRSSVQHIQSPDAVCLAGGEQRFLQVLSLSAGCPALRAPDSDGRRRWEARGLVWLSAAPRRTACATARWFPGRNATTASASQSQALTPTACTRRSRPGRSSPTTHRWCRAGQRHWPIASPSRPHPPSPQYAVGPGGDARAGPPANAASCRIAASGSALPCAIRVK